MLPVMFLPPAQADARHAAEWLRGISPLLALEFRKELRRIIDEVRDHPEMYQRFLDGCRRAVMHRFDYAVFYRPLPDRIQIVAVFHCRLDPAMIEARVQATH